MGKNSNIIEINGRRYDAATGKQLGDGAPQTVSHSHAVIGPARSEHSGVIQGVHAEASAHQADSVKHSPHKADHAASRHVSRTPAVAPHGHQPERTKTLMRHAVQKPGPKPKSSLKAHGQAHPSASAPQTEAYIVPKLTADIVSQQRLNHAKSVAKSRLISRYNLGAGPTPVIADVAKRPTVHTPPRPAVPVSRRPQTTDEMLQHAIDRATSHQQAPPKIRKSRHAGRIVGVSSVILLPLVLFGFVIHQNLPNMKVDLASSRAGFAVTLPAKQPAGFSLSELSSNANKVMVTFHSDSDSSRTYVITEQPSDWDSATLRDSYVSQQNGQTYQTVETADRTFYLYGHHNITWVSGGVWYQVRSNGALDDKQLIDLAASVQ